MASSGNVAASGATAAVVVGSGGGGTAVGGPFGRVMHCLWGEISGQELRKFGLLAMTFFCIIGSYWMLRPTKAGVFHTIVGLEYLPTARMVSFACIVPLILGYSKLVDMFPKHQLVYIVVSLYGTLFALLGLALASPTVGVANTEASPYRLVGWVAFVVIESYGSITVALFWSFVASCTSAASAKRGYALIITGGQVGSISGPLIATQTRNGVTIPMVFGMAVVATGLVLCLVRLYMQKVGFQEEQQQQQQQAAPDPSKQRPGVLVGLRLLFSDAYLLGIFGVSTIYEVVATITDLQLQMLAREQYPLSADYTSFMATFGVCVNVLSFVVALTGTSVLMRRLGVRVCLLLYPCGVLVALCVLLQFPVLPVVFAAQIVTKGLSYAVNNPTKEMLYLCTTPDVKFKVKSWIDMFGGRSAKATGAVIVSPLAESLPRLLSQGTMLSLLVTGFWLAVAAFTGRRNAVVAADAAKAEANKSPSKV